jgi:arylsulfatase A-like enzyme
VTRRLLLGSGLLSTVLLAFLWARGNEDGAGFVVRFVEEDPDEILVPEAILAAEPVLSWSFDQPDEARQWAAMGSDGRLSVEKGALVVAARGVAPQIWCDVDVGADTVDEVRIVAEGVVTTSMRLLWARTGETFSAVRTSSAWGTAREDGTTLFSLRVARHPLWSGSIDAIRIDPTLGVGDSVRIRHVGVVRHRVDPDALGAAGRRPWKVDLRNDLRSGYVGVPSLPLDRDVDLPKRAVLRFSYGLTARAAGFVRFLVMVTPPGAQPLPVFEGGIDGARPEAVELWHEGSVDLARFGGQRVRISLRVQPEAPLEREGGLPVWGPVEASRARGGASLPNVVLVSADTLRADRLSLYGHPRPTSPALDAWARRAGVTFRSAVAPASTTLPSHVSLFTGLEAHRHGVNYDLPAPPSLITLAERLRAAGYATLGVTGGGYVSPSFGLAQGFDQYRSWREPPGTYGRQESELRSGVAEAMRLMDAHRDRPFFLFLHTYAVHAPYFPRQPHFRRLGGRFVDAANLYLATRQLVPKFEEGFVSRRVFAWVGDEWGPPSAGVMPEDVELARRLYDSGVAMLDTEMGRLLAHLSEAGIEDRTIVVFTSDHGEMLGEHGLADHGYLYDENLLVPLVIAAPGRGLQPRFVDDQVRLIDVFPTILDLVGLAKPDHIDGASLVPLLHGEAAEPRDAWSYSPVTNAGLALRTGEGGIKYTFNDTAWSPVQGREQLFQLRSDPGEQRDLAGSMDTGRLRDAAVRRLARSTGLWIRLSNAGTESLTGTLSGILVGASQVKSAAPLRRGSVEWRDVNELAYDIAPGESATLRLTWVPAAETILEGTMVAGQGRSYSVAQQISLAELEQGHALVGMADGRWQRSRIQDPGPPTGIRVWWQGEHGISRARPGTAAPEVLEQLRGLGYLR